MYSVVGDCLFMCICFSIINVLVLVVFFIKGELCRWNTFFIVGFIKFVKIDFCGLLFLLVFVFISRRLFFEELFKLFGFCYLFIFKLILILVECLLYYIFF